MKTNSTVIWKDYEKSVFVESLKALDLTNEVMNEQKFKYLKWVFTKVIDRCTAKHPYIVNAVCIYSRTFIK